MELKASSTPMQKYHTVCNFCALFLWEVSVNMVRFERHKEEKESVSILTLILYGESFSEDSFWAY